jgi:archaellum component FlaC
MVSNIKDLNIDDIKKDVEALKDSLAAQTKQLKNLAENQLNKMKEKGKGIS